MEKPSSTERPSWEDWGLLIAQAVAARGDCTRAQVGAVIIAADHRIVATGYNGTAPGAAGCLAGACERGRLGEIIPRHQCIAIHAEANAIMRASWEEMVGATLYTTKEPCDACFRLFMGTPLEAVIWPGEEVEEPDKAGYLCLPKQN